MTPDISPREFPDPLPAHQWLPSAARLRQITVDFPDPLPPPPQPPVVYFMRHGSEHERQEAMLAVSQWSLDQEGNLVTKSLADLPIQRPAPLDVSCSDIVIVRIATESAPLMLNAWHYEQLKPDGHVTGEHVSLAAWLHPRRFSQGAQQNAQLARYNAAGDPPGWEFAVRLPQTAGESHIVLWAQWGMFSASWTVSAKR